MQKWLKMNHFYKYITSIYSPILPFPYNMWLSSLGIIASVFYRNQKNYNKNLMGLTVSPSEEEVPPSKSSQE